MTGRSRVGNGLATAAAYLLLGTWVLSHASAALGQVSPENAGCLECHGRDKDLRTTRDGRPIELYVDAEQFAQSVHGQFTCVTCHVELEDTELPHKYDGLERVDCTECHDEEAEDYAESIHGQRLEEGVELAPVCQDCHGDHYIVRLDDPGSAIAPFNVPQMCAQCHAEGAPVSRAYGDEISQEQILKRYTQSIHGEGLFKQGLTVTAVCTSCHTGHNVLPHTDPRSTTSKENITATCMKCHGLIEAVHRKRIKGSLWEDEPHKVPMCVECHSPHEARKERLLYDTGVANSDCLSCHADTDIRASSDQRSLHVDIEELSASIHGREIVACAQCHTGVSPERDRACETITEKVDCAICHEAQVSNYTLGIHGQLHARGDLNAPYCTDCHGRHNMLEHEVPADAPELLRLRVRESATFVLNIPTLCAKCHREGGQAAVRYLGDEHEIVAHYSMSIHGKGLRESGLTVTATCIDCHTPHKELPHSDPDSSVHPDNIARTCGTCHDGIYEKYSSSVHSPTANTEYDRLQGMHPLPRCSDCHSSHTIARTDIDDFKLRTMDQCGNCHGDVAKTYFDTYHGKVSKLGSAKTAKCYDCHGAHDTRKVTDPDSRLSRKHIVATCAQCHPGSHRRFAGYLTHATHHDPDKYPALFYAFWGMTGLLVGTFAFFGLHTLVWLPRSWRMRKVHKEVEIAVDPQAMQFVRFTQRNRVMHLVMLLSFFGLAITGMMLKFSYTQWAAAVSRVLGGFEAAGFIHRTCAVAMFGVFVVHLWDVLRRYLRSNKSVFRFLFGPNTILLTRSDIGEFIGTVKWFLGRGPRPQYGRWAYWEKFDYFAVFWGIIIIGSTGLLLWFPEKGTFLLPGWVINVATIIHSDEALLATGFIFTIHFFNTHFRPEKFPMDTVIFTGKMPLEELKRERPREYEELVAAGTLDERLAEPSPLVVTRAVKVLAFVALAVGLTLVVLIIYAMVFGYK